MVVSVCMQTLLPSMLRQGEAKRVMIVGTRTSSGRRADEALFRGPVCPFLKHARRSKNKTVTFWNSTHLPLGAWVFGAPHTPPFFHFFNYRKSWSYSLLLCYGVDYVAAAAGGDGVAAVTVFDYGDCVAF